MTNRHSFAVGLLAAALCPLAVAASADSAPSIPATAIATCSAEQNPVKRLACFDAIAETNGLNKREESTTQAGAGKWHTSQRVDPLNDQGVYSALLFADVGVSRSGKKVALMVRCSSNKTDMFIAWESYLGRDSARVTYRVGKDEAITSDWPNSTDNQVSFFPGSPVPILKKLADGATSFVANVTPYNSSPITAVFDTAGADAALADIRKACGW